MTTKGNVPLHRLKVILAKPAWRYEAPPGTYVLDFRYDHISGVSIVILGGPMFPVCSPDCEPISIFEEEGETVEAYLGLASYYLDDGPWAILDMLRIQSRKRRRDKLKTDMGTT